MTEKDLLALLTDPARTDELLQELIQIKLRRDQSVLPPVLLCLQAANPEVRARAADALAEIGEGGDATLEASLILLLSDVESTVRYSAIQALEALRCRSASGKISEVLQNDSDELVKVAAAEALGYLGDASALSALIGALDDADAVVRSFAACSIGLLAAEENRRHIEETILWAEKTEVDLIVKMELLIAGYRIGYREFKPRLRELLFHAPGLTRDNVTPVLNGIQCLIEYRPPSQLPGDAEFFSAILNEISDQFPSEQTQAQRLISLLTAAQAAD